MPRTTLQIGSSDIPQAPNLARVRLVIAAIAGGTATVDEIAEETDISARHLGYALRAAQALDLLDSARRPTPAGLALIETEQESAEERAAFRRSVETSAILQAIAPTLLSEKPPTKKALATRIEKLTGLSSATAAHRASDLLAWREQILEEAEVKPEPKAAVEPAAAAEPEAAPAVDAEAAPAAEPEPEPEPDVS